MKFLLERKRHKLAAEIKARQHAEEDLLSPALSSQFDKLLDRLQSAGSAELPETIDAVKKDFAALPLPEKRGTMYAFLDLIAVVGAVAFGLRGLFFQPFQIPTSSMQPTLYGIHYVSKVNASNPYIAKLPAPLKNLLFGVVEAFAVTGNGGMLNFAAKEGGWLIDRTRLLTDGGDSISLPGNESQVLSYIDADPQQPLPAGKVIADGHVSLGDHLFVERFSLYLSPPKRGDIIVFTTDNLSYNGEPLAASSGNYYIKRVAALPLDTVKIVKNQLYVKPYKAANFSKIQEIAPKFRKVYSGKGGYHGHLSDIPDTLPFANGSEYTVPEDHYLMLGDNSSFSLDSRYFGPVHRNNLVGRAFITFYPLSRRTGLIDRQEPLDTPTGEPVGNSYPVMYRQ